MVHPRPRPIRWSPPLQARGPPRTRSKEQSPANFPANLRAIGRVFHVTPREQQRHDLFLRLYMQQEDALRGFVRSLVPTLEDAREVMQEVAAVLWRKFDTLESDSDFRRWAFGVARFEAFHFLRTRRRDRHVFSPDVLEALATDAEHQSTSQNAEVQAVEECLTKLPPAQRALVESAYAPGVRIEALARETGRSAMALYKSLHRVRLLLMQCVRQILKKGERA